MLVGLILDIVYAIVLVLLMPMVLFRLISHGRYRHGWLQRFGFSPIRTGNKKCIWIHAVSMGEVNAVSTLIAEFGKQMPEYEIVISTTTDTGISRASKLYGDKHIVFFYPFDFTSVVRRAFSRIRPDICVLMELEVWHNFTMRARRLSVPVVVANGRISSGKGFPRYKRIAKLVRPMFSRISLALVQDEDYAGRFRYLGVPDDKVRVAGSLKYDTAEIIDKVEGADELAEALKIGNGPVWVSGSTGPGEEEILLDVFDRLGKNELFSGLRLIIVPRKPERFDEVSQLIIARGDGLIRYSRIKDGRQKVSVDDKSAVILGDTMGDLRKFYSLASVIFVGRSLSKMGGSDMMEAAALAKPVIVGPYTENFTETVEKLKISEGIEIVADGMQLERAIEKILTNPDYADKLSLNGRKVITANKGATQITVESIKNLVNV